jgi:hypothetical protein
MTTAYKTFHTFYNLDEAQAFVALLKENLMAYECSDNVSQVMSTLINTGNINQNYIVKLEPEDFAQANVFLTQMYAEQASRVNRSYAYFSLDDAALLDKLSQVDKISKLDEAIARRILAERGVEVNEAALFDAKAERMAQLAKPEKIGSKWIILGYLFLLVSSGIFTILIGWQLYTYKKVLPNDKAVYVYDESTRKHGKTFMILGATVLLLGLAYLVFGLLVR